jgi:predicted DNA-binding transcriptional regulator AlpA
MTLQPQMLLTTPEAAALCRISKSTLEHARVRGDGPPFIRVGRKRIAYHRDALEAWLTGRQVTSTSVGVR